jgi:hypothetical protein
MLYLPAVAWQFIIKTDCLCNDHLSNYTYQLGDNFTTLEVWQLMGWIAHVTRNQNTDNFGQGFKTAATFHVGTVVVTFRHTHRQTTGGPRDRSASTLRTRKFHGYSSKVRINKTHRAIRVPPEILRLSH